MKKKALEKTWKAVYFPEGRTYVVETTKKQTYSNFYEAKRKALSYTNRTKKDALIYRSVGYTTPRRK